jgi:SpoU rRNA methylase family enzyme
MYDGLIKALRDMSKMGMKYGMAVITTREAADAIEELQADKTALNGTVTNLLEQIKDRRR